MSDALLLVAFVLAMVTLVVVFFGAPYVPTRARDLDKLFKAAQLKKGDTLVDLGSGDGRLLLGAADRGIKSVGVELNFLLVLLTQWRIRRVRKLAQVRFGNFWRQELPEDTTAVFVFLAEPFMKRLREYLEAEAKRLGRPITLVSYGFSLPGYKPVRSRDAVLVYEIKP